jgi:sorbitol-specific phosphotransferase system component IIA
MEQSLYFLLMREFFFPHWLYEFNLTELKQFYILALGSVVMSKLQDTGHLHLLSFSFGLVSSSVSHRSTVASSLPDLHGIFKICCDLQCCRL